MSYNGYHTLCQFCRFWYYEPNLKQHICIHAQSDQFTEWHKPNDGCNHGKYKRLMRLRRKGDGL